MKSGSETLPKNTRLLIRDEVAELIGLHNLVAQRALDKDPEGGAIASLQRAIDSFGKCLVLDMCAHKKENMAAVKHISITGSDVINAVTDLSEMTHREEHVFFKYMKPCVNDLGSEGNTDSKDPKKKKGGPVTPNRKNKVKTKKRKKLDGDTVFLNPFFMPMFSEEFIDCSVNFVNENNRALV